MKISIENFKSIRSLHNFQIKPLTVLSGTNSSGKSSFIQLLLLLKQTVEKSSTDDVFTLDGSYYLVRNFIDLINKKSKEKRITVGFSFDEKELNSENILLKLSKNADILIDFIEKERKTIVSKFKIEIKSAPKNPYIKIEKNKEDDLFSLITNDNSFGDNIWNQDIDNAILDFEAFYPTAFQYNGNKNFFKIDWSKDLINNYLKSIRYLGPDRESPKSEYISSRKTIDFVGIKGEFVAQVLQKKANEQIEYFEIGDKDNVNYNKKTNSLSEAVKYWMCEIFGVAEDLYVKKSGDVYQILLKIQNSIEVNIKHLGYGISQLLPIVVEGLLMKKGTLIVEQPKIHLHPKIQSQLFDFLYSLTLQGKNVIVETHSSHFITRMRRRIAESEDKIFENINLTFIEDKIFRTIKLNDFGSMDYFPKDFIEKDAEELKAIVEAQMKKRMKNKEK